MGVCTRGVISNCRQYSSQTKKKRKTVLPEKDVLITDVTKEKEKEKKKRSNVFSAFARSRT